MTLPCPGRSELRDIVPICRAAAQAALTWRTLHLSLATYDSGQLTASYQIN